MAEGCLPVKRFPGSPFSYPSHPMVLYIRSILETTLFRAWGPWNNIEAEARNWRTLGSVSTAARVRPIGNRQRSKINYREICGPVIAVIIASALNNASHGGRTFDAHLTRSLLFFFSFLFSFIPPSPSESVHISSSRYISRSRCVTTIAMKDKERICIGRNFPRVSQALFRDSLSSSHFEATRFLVARGSNLITWAWLCPLRNYSFVGPLSPVSSS